MRIYLIPEFNKAFKQISLEQEQCIPHSKI